MRYKVDNGLMHKRSKAVSSTYNTHDCGLYLEKALDSIKEKSDRSKSSVRSFFSECSCKANANKYYTQCIGIIREINHNDENFAESLVKEFNSSILPYIDNMDAVSYALEKSGLDYNLACSIDKAINEFKICDRITRNHYTIQDKVNLESVISSNKNRGLNRIVPKCCRMICEVTKDLKPHGQMNVCLEELSYMLSKEHIDYNKSDLVKYVSEFFLSKPNMDDDVKAKYKKVLTENSMISDTDLSKVKYFTEEETYDDSKSVLITMLNKFILSKDKNINDDFGVIIRTAPIGHLIPRNDFCTNFETILEYIRINLTTEDYDIQQVIDLLNTIPENIESEMNNDTPEWNYTREELDTIVSTYLRAVDILTREIDNCDIVQEEKYVKLKDCYLAAVDKINALKGLVYTEYNIRCMSEMIAVSESAEPLYLEEFKLFKFQNLITAAIAAEKLIKSKAKKFTDSIKGKINLRKKKKAFEDIPVEECISMESRLADVCVASFDILNEDNFYEIHDIITDICKSLNETTLYNTEFRSYYRVLPGTVEIRLESVNTILLSKDEISNINEIFSTEDKERIIELQEMASIYEKIDFDRLNNIIEEIASKMPSLDEDRVSGIFEASQYLSNISQEDINKLGSLYKESHNGYNTSTQRILYEWSHYESPIELQVEAFDIICSLLESNDEKKKVNNDNKKLENNKEKTPMEKIKDKANQAKEKKEERKEQRIQKVSQSITNLKLYAQGLKAKFKDMSAKEKEWSKDIDMTFNRLAKGCKDALISDRREAIIKGSIIPSFSKCIKIGIGLAGLTFINPVAGAVAAIGGVAMSKNLTRKERLLLLDEIETELQVVDKEIDHCGEHNIKKYRKLLNYKKDLQRQYQRIKYNVRIGKDILPGSTTGLKDTDK